MLTMTIERIARRNQAGFLILLLALGLLLPLRAEAAGIVRTLLEKQPDKEFIVFQTTAPIHHQSVFLLQNPDRVVVDLDKSEGSGVSLPASAGAVLVRNIRFGQFDADTSRIVIDLTAPIKSASLHQFSAANGQPHRIVIELEPLKGGGSLRGLVTEEKKRYPSQQKKPAPPPGKPIIVIDAGHGGKDPGARGIRGTREKDITLPFALAMRKALLRTGRYDVVLTRETDIFILLHERVRIGQRARGAAFISIHADSAPSGSKARGLSIYTVSETASDEESAALAAQENKSDVIDGLDLGAEVDKEVANILIDLAQRETKNKSAKLADMMVKQFSAQGIHLLPNTHRFAGFRVLKSPEVPSVLIETGFLSNKEDEKLLKSDAYRAKVIKSVIYGLDNFFAK